MIEQINDELTAVTPMAGSAATVTREKIALAPGQAGSDTNASTRPGNLANDVQAQTTWTGTDPISKLRELSTRNVAAMETSRLLAAKRSYATRRIQMNDAATLISGAVRPKAGDLVLARVDVLGHHRKLESPAGRRAKLYPGDEILLLYGNRYATDQFEAIIPDNLGPCNMVAGGGIAARAVLSNSNARQPTIIEPLGLVGDCDGMPLNLRTYAEPTPRLMPEDTLGTSHMPAKRTARVIVVVGTSMNAGKTTMAASLIKGLARGGYKVGAGKVTGTGAGGDRWSVTDAGANQIIDFTDFGYPSTYLLSDQTLARLFADICDALCNGGNDYVVLEIADGLFFPETSGLVQAPEFHQRVDDVMLAASDAMGASAGVRFLAEKNLGVYAIGGKITASPLAAREAGRVIDVQFVSSHELASPDWAFPAAT